MLEAKFYMNPNPDFPNMPVFTFIDVDEGENFWMLSELLFCNLEYVIDKVLPNIKKVFSGELLEYEFGYDATIITLKKEVAIIDYNYFENRMEIPAQPMYDFVIAWGEFLLSIDK